MDKFLAPNTWATIPFVAGTVANHKSPNVTPKAIAEISEGGRNMNKPIDIALKKYNKLKILGSGDLKEKFNAEVNFISSSAKEKIEKLGGKVTLVK